MQAGSPGILRKEEESVSGRTAVTAGIVAGLRRGEAVWNKGKQIRRYMIMGKLGKVLAAGAGVIVAAGAAATAGIVVGLKKWAKDEESQDIKIVFGGEYGLKITKGEKPGEFQIDTKYDWQNDPDFIDEIAEDECCGECDVEVVEEEAPCCCAEEVPVESGSECCCCEEEPCKCEETCECGCTEAEAQA